MRLQILPLLLIIINFAVDYYIYSEIKKAAVSRWVNLCNCLISGLFLALIVAVLIIPKRTVDNDCLVAVMWMLYAYMSFYLPKYVYVLVTLLGKAVLYPFKKKSNLFRWIGIAGAVVSFIVLIWSGFVTPKSVNVNTVEIQSEKLPTSFDGFKIVQFSDFHLGTYGRDTTYVSKVVNEINSLNPDVIVFTGDLVNRQTSEALPFRNTLKRLRARYGVYSILGNHDYGDYMDWDSDAAKQKNNVEFAEFQRSLGWHLLNNAHVVIHKDNDSIMLIGVENWGDPPFPKYGDLHKAYPQLNDDNYKILLSHNPVQWKAQIVDTTNIDLMLSGHTHAMQMEFQIGKQQISPSSLRYPEWGGLYEDNGQKLYVNIGLGEVVFPMRIGAIPEITLLELTQTKGLK